VENARVERTLLSAAFDFAFVLELKEHMPLSTTVEEQRFQRRVRPTQKEQGFSPCGTSVQQLKKRGKGYQTRINAILRSYMKAQSNNAR
jgi:hypothetical protein